MTKASCRWRGEGDPLEGSRERSRGLRVCQQSGGSQFFICLSREKCQSLDRKYTAFGKVFSGMEAVHAIAGAELSDPAAGTPKERQAINSIRMQPVTAKDNPYRSALKLDMADTSVSTAPTDAPATQPVVADPVPIQP